MIFGSYNVRFGLIGRLRKSLDQELFLFLLSWKISFLCFYIQAHCEDSLPGQDGFILNFATQW